jgi:hypothetical protein
MLERRLAAQQLRQRGVEVQQRGAQPGQLPLGCARRQRLQHIRAEVGGALVADQGSNEPPAQGGILRAAMHIPLVRTQRAPCALLVPARLLADSRQQPTCRLLRTF